MNDLEKLIQNLCPNGVERIRIGAFAKVQKTKNKGHISEEAYSITQRGLIPTNEFFGEKTKITSSDTSGYYLVYKDWFVYSPSRIDVGSINYLKVNGPVIVSPLDVVFSVDEEKILPLYLLTYLLSLYGMRQILDHRQGIEGTGRRTLPFAELAKVEVPLPPLPIQQRIVEILDKFTSLVSSLDSEIALRQKQYEFAGERIFCSIDQQYQWIPLGDVCEVFDGVHQTPEYVEKGIRFVSVENIDDIYGSNKYITEDAYNKYKNKPKVGDIFMTRITAGVIGQCAIVDKDEPLAYYVSLALLRPKKGISSRYLRAYLHSSTGKKELRKWIKVDATPTKINKGDINKVLILVPSFNRQLSIVRTLDTFESLLTNLKKERELRQKQYEYYREKLLTFA